MHYAKESIFVSAIRAFFNTLLGTLGLFIAIIPTIIILAFFSTGREEVGKTKLEILPDHKGNMKLLPGSTPAILRINIHGPIGMNKGVKASDIDYQLLDSRKGFLKNNRVKAILLHINSPGGTVIEGDNIYRNLLQYKEKYKVPIYVYTDGLCASGGMWIACSADKIYSSPVSIIGSIGVRLGPFFNVVDALDKFGVKSKTLTEGKDKDAMNPFRKWKTDEDLFFKELNEYYYNMFVGIVSKSRNIEKDKLINEYGAHIFDPVKAAEIKYIDKANVSYNDTLVELIKAANLDPKKSYQVVSLTPKKNWLSPITGEAFSKLFKNFVIRSLFDEDINNKQDNFYYMN